MNSPCQGCFFTRPKYEGDMCMKNKAFKLIYLVLLITIALSACETTDTVEITPKDDTEVTCELAETLVDGECQASTTCDEGQHYDADELKCVIDPIEVETCLEGYQEINEQCIKITNPSTPIYDELPAGDLDELVAVFNQIYLQNQNVYQLVVDSELELQNLSYDLGYGVMTSITSKLEIDMEDFYIHTLSLLEGYKPISEEFIFVKDNNIVSAVPIEHDITETVLSEDASLGTKIKILGEMGFLGKNSDYSFLGNVNQINDREYTAQMTFEQAYIFFGSEFMSSFEVYQGTDFTELRFELTFTIDEDLNGYLTEVDFFIKGYQEGIQIETTIAFSQTTHFGSFDRKSQAEMGYRQESYSSIDDIQTDAPFGVYSIFNYDKEQDNWIRYHLEPGIYKLITWSNSELYDDIEIYDETNKLLYQGYPLIIEDAAYYYIKLNVDPVKYTEDFFYFTIEDSLLEDVSIITITDDSGVIEGHTEGKGDVNKLIIPADGTSKFIRFDLELPSQYDLAFIHMIDTNLAASTKYLCDGVNGCTYQLSLTEDLVIKLFSTEEFDYSINYTVISPTITTNDISNVSNISDINAFSRSNPIMIDTNHRDAYFLITVEEDGKYQVNDWCTYSSCNNMYYEIYDINGTLIVSDPSNGHQLEAGTFIIRFTTENKQDFTYLFYPTLAKRN